MAPPRIQIQNVEPQVDCGRYPVKACLGDDVRVSATIFRDGHSRIGGVVRFRARGTRRWREVALEARGNDRFEATVTPDALGRWELRIQAWSDPYASWLDEYDRKVAAGQADLGGELSEGAVLFGAGTVDEWRAAAAGHSDRERHGSVKGSVLGVDVERERARFGAWYELFPRSFGGFKGVAAVLPELAALGFDVVYLPPVHPIGFTHRKGRNNAERARKGDPGSPWAIGADSGGHDALHPDLGTDADFDAMVAGAKAAGLELALDFAIQCSPDHPWLVEHPEWFERRPDGTLKYAENPPKRYQDIYNLDWDTGAREKLWNALRDVVLGWCARGIRVYRVDNPHTKPVPFWEWLIAEVRAAYPDAIFLAEAFTRPGADDDARQGRLQPVVHVLRVEEHARPSSSSSSTRRARGRRSTGRTCGRTRRTSSTSTCRWGAARRSRRGSSSPPRSRRATGSTRATRPARMSPCGRAARSTSTRRSTR